MLNEPGVGLRSMRMSPRNFYTGISCSSSMRKVIVVKPTKEDFPQVFSLLQQLWVDKSLDKDKIRKAFETGLVNSQQEYRIAVCSSRTVGFASLNIRNSLWQEGSLGHLDELVVDERFRKRGIGTRLLDEMTKIAKARLCRKIELDSAFHRKEAHEFYIKQGFENRAYVFSKDLY